MKTPSTAIGMLEQEIEELDDRRAKLVAARDVLRPPPSAKSTKPAKPAVTATRQRRRKLSSRRPYILAAADLLTGPVAMKQFIRTIAPKASRAEYNRWLGAVHGAVVDGKLTYVNGVVSRSNGTQGAQ